MCVIGHQKGRDTKQKIYRNFGMPKPEGYRKALRVMELAESSRRPILSFVDTPGAYPGLDAEERGQAEAIACNLREMARLETPIVVTVTGEGGSGGALAIAVGDRVNMLEHSVYSVISPEGCASILWRDAGARRAGGDRDEDHGRRPARAGAGRRDRSRSRRAARTSTTRRSSRRPTRCCGASCSELLKVPKAKLTDQRYQKFRDMGRQGREFIELS